MEPPSWNEWVGLHRLAVWTTAGTLKPDSTTVNLRLDPPKVEFKAPACQVWGCPPDGPIIPLVGWTVPAYDPPWMSSIGHSTSSRDTAQPGAILIWKPRGRQLTLMLGNSGTMTDAGVIFDVFAVSPELLVGRWVDGGIGVYANGDGNHPQGYFCLFRRDSARPNRSLYLLDFTRPAAEALKLPELATASRRGVKRELRLWTGFGLTGVALLVLRETGKGWTGTDYYPVGEKHAPRKLEVPSDSAARLWRAAVDAGLESLPPEPRRPPTDLFIDDGYSVVIEWADSTGVHATPAANPDVFCSPDDERIMAVVRAVFGRPAPRCMKVGSDTH